MKWGSPCRDPIRRCVQRMWPRARLSWSPARSAPGPYVCDVYRVTYMIEARSAQGLMLD
jgi:hypothetical protein